MKRTCLALVTLALSLVACSGSWMWMKAWLPSERREQVEKAAEAYAVDLRWGRVDEAAALVDPEVRAAFLELMSDPDRAPRFTDFQMEGVVTPKPGRAEIRVRFELYNPPAISERHIVETQTWRLEDGRWLLVPDLALYRGEVGVR